MNYTKTGFKKSSFTYTVTVAVSDVKKEEQAAFSELTSKLEVKGFRRGKAPATVAKKHISKEEVHIEILNRLLPKIYSDIVTKENLKPIISPRISLKKTEEGQDWEFELEIAVKPEVKLPDYKKIAKEVKASQKKADIWIPGKEEPKKDEGAGKEQFADEVVKKLLEAAEIEIPDLVIETEMSRRLTKLLDDVAKIGLTIESYLTSKNLTIDTLKEQYRAEIEQSFKLELLLDSLCDDAGIVVEPEELKETLDKMKAEDIKNAALIDQNSYLYAIIMRRQKLLEFLTNL